MSSLREIFKQKYEHKSYPARHYKPRPNGIDCIIIHSMAEYLKGNGHASEFLDEIGLSAHFLIEPDGTVIKCVEPVNQAYHAGKSKLGDQTNLNTTSIGIEVLVEGRHNYSSFLDAIKIEGSYKYNQYDSTAVLCSLLCTEFDIPTDRIVRHSDVSGPDIRPDDPKHDPGKGFDWKHLKTLTTEFINQLNSAND